MIGVGLSVYHCTFNYIILLHAFRRFTKDCPTSIICTKPYVSVSVVTVVRAKGLVSVKEGIGRHSILTHTEAHVFFNFIAVCVYVCV